MHRWYPMPTFQHQKRQGSLCLWYRTHHVRRLLCQMPTWRHLRQRHQEVRLRLWIKLSLRQHPTKVSLSDRIRNRRQHLFKVPIQLFHSKQLLCHLSSQLCLQLSLKEVRMLWRIPLEQGRSLHQKVRKQWSLQLKNRKLRLLLWIGKSQGSLPNLLNWNHPGNRRKLWRLWSQPTISWWSMPLHHRIHSKPT